MLNFHLYHDLSLCNGFHGLKLPFVVENERLKTPRALVLWYDSALVPQSTARITVSIASPVV